MSELNRQDICAALGVSESTIRRLEQRGLPYTPVGKRSHRYDLAECKAWLKANPAGEAPPKAATWRPSTEFIEASSRQRRRVEPS